MAGPHGDLDGGEAEVLAVGLHEPPERVEAEVAEVSLHAEAAEVEGDSPWPPRGSAVEGVGEHVSVGGECCTTGGGSLPHHVHLGLEGLDGRGVDSHLADSAVLRRRLVDALALDLDDASSDGDGLAVPVDVVHPEGADLAPAHPGGGRQEEHPGVLGPALDLATEAGEVDLIAYLWMRKANVASDARRPQLIRQCAEAGLANSRKLTPRMRAVILRVEAHAHAMSGDYDACARTIEAALAEVTNSTSRSNDLADYCTAGYIQMEAAHCWTELGRPEAAIEHLAAEVEVWDPSFRRDLGLCLARLGVAEAKAGDLESAAASGRRSLAIVTQTRSRRTVDQLQVLAELLDRPASVDEAAQLRSALVDLDHHELPALEGPPEWI